MIETIFKPEAVCSREVHIFHEDGIIMDAQVIGGCRGNLQGICALIKGRKIDDVVKALSGIKCPGSRTGLTSCPDQIAKGLSELLK